MRNFSCSSREDDGRVVVEAGGEVDLAVADRLWTELESRLVPGGRVVLDCTDVTFLDSTGLQVLLRAVQTAAAVGAGFELAGRSEAVSRTLVLAGLADMFPPTDA
jgi:anti-anti-sigma factor